MSPNKKIVVMYLNSSFEVVEEDSPELALVEVTYPDGRKVFGKPVKKNLEEFEWGADTPIGMIDRYEKELL